MDYAEFKNFWHYMLYRLGIAKCKIFQKKQLILPIDLSRILHVSLPTP